MLHWRSMLTLLAAGALSLLATLGGAFHWRVKIGF